jgi:hypothetical protein
MAGFEFWRDLQVQFRDLEGRAHHNFHAMLCRGEWSCSGGPSDRVERESVQTQFSALATWAGAALQPRSANPLGIWLDALRTRSPYFHSQTGSSVDEDGVVVEDPVGGYIERPCAASTELCITLHAEAFVLSQKSSGGLFPTPLGRNIDLLSKECGWGIVDLAKATGLSEKLIRGHKKNGKRARNSTLKEYADAFSEKLGRPVVVADLEK